MNCVPLPNNTCFVSLNRTLLEMLKDHKLKFSAQANKDKISRCITVSDTTSKHNYFSSDAILKFLFQMLLRNN